MDANLIVLGLTYFVVFLFSTTLHEAAHAWSAYKLGDPTAYEGGQVTLNPLPHIQREPWGMILIPLVSFSMSGGQSLFGWASAPYDPSWARHYPKRAALMAAAGPAANLLLAVVAGLLIRFSGLMDVQGVAESLRIMFRLNVLLFAFNLLPVPPLDGSAILPALMSESMAERYRETIHQPMFALIGLLVAWSCFRYIYAPILYLASWLFGIGP